MSVVCIAIGSNLGDRWSYLNAAVRRLRADPGLCVLKCSTLYETRPEHCPPESGPFLNAAMVIETDLSPEDLLSLLMRIERQFGRVRSEANSPRTVDLDLLLYGNRIINTPDLTIPHPRMRERSFVLIPLVEIAPEVVDPVTGQSVSQLEAALKDRSGIAPSVKPLAANLAFEGLRVLVTGSSGGIGRSVALAFAGAGAEVFVHGRSSSKIEETARLCRELSLPREIVVHSCQADLKDPGQVDSLALQTWTASQGLDVLVSNAGADVLTGEAATWSFDDKLDALLAVDLKATMRLARDIGTRMKLRGRGCIITVGWDQAEAGMEGDSGQLFAAIKGAVTSFTRSLAKSLAPEVRVNCIAPGWIRTSWGERASKEWQERVRRETPLGVWGLPEDVAETAIWLASPSARFITGQTVRVNGGVVLHG